jgi:hypothetical protein
MRRKRVEASFTDLFLSFHRNPTIIPRTTLTTREIENKAINILFETFEFEQSSSEVVLAVDSKILNSIVKVSNQFYIEDIRLSDDVILTKSLYSDEKSLSH